MLYLLATLIVVAALVLGATLGHRIGYVKGSRDGRRKLMGLMRRMLEDEEYADSVLAAGRTVLTADGNTAEPAGD